MLKVLKLVCAHVELQAALVAPVIISDDTHDHSNVEAA